MHILAIPYFSWCCYPDIGVTISPLACCLTLYLFIHNSTCHRPMQGWAKQSPQAAFGLPRDPFSPWQVHILCVFACRTGTCHRDVCGVYRGSTLGPALSPPCNPCPSCSWTTLPAWGPIPSECALRVGVLGWFPWRLCLPTLSSNPSGGCRGQMGPGLDRINRLSCCHAMPAP